jgi:hypothetical protein
MRQPPAYVYFLTARAMAHLDEPVALEYLQEAVAAGFKDWELLQTLPEFATLSRMTPIFLTRRGA